MSGIKVGALYKTIEIDGARLDIYYGFYNEREKELGYHPTLGIVGLVIGCVSLLGTVAMAVRDFLKKKRA